MKREEESLREDEALAGEDLSAMSQRELDDLGQALLAQLTQLKEARRIAVDRSQAVMAERARRRKIALEESYDERRRNAVLSGSYMPAPPPSRIAGPAPTSAARRLASFSLTLSRPAPQEVVIPAVSATRQPVEIHGTGVSDHAIVRYLERALDIDIDHIRSLILTPYVREGILAGMSRIRTPEGVVVFRDGTVTSFLPVESGPKHPRKVPRGKPDDGWSSQDARALDLSDD